MSALYDSRPVGTMEADTIAAIATSTGEAGIGIVRISGPEAFAIGSLLFRAANGRRIDGSSVRKLLYGHIYDEDRVVDEVLISFQPGPHTYTVEDVVEINGHGGPISMRRILELVLRSGARLAEPGEFTKRAFLNGRLDLSQAEAVRDIISARTTAAHEQALRQLSGSVSSSVSPIREEILDLLSHLEYAINFMEDAQEDLPVDPMIEKARKISSEISALLASAERGRIIRDGIRTVIAGQPNVGKSSLLNALLRDNRAIVTDIPGTTRDAIEESYNLDGVLLRLIDTAGIRETEDIVEALGVDRSRALIDEADLVLAILDGSRVPEESEEKLFEEISKKENAIYLMNKTDLTVCPEALAFRKRFIERHPDSIWIDIAARTGDGLDRLQQAILDLFFDGRLEQDDSAMITNIRHRDLLSEAQRELSTVAEDLEAGIALDAVEVDCRSAYRKLCEITGDSMEDEVLDRIFRDFCIGK